MLSLMKMMPFIFCFVSFFFIQSYNAFLPLCAETQILKEPHNTPILMFFQGFRDNCHLSGNAIVRKLRELTLRNAGLTSWMSSLRIRMSSSIPRVAVLQGEEPGWQDALCLIGSSHKMLTYSCEPVGDLRQFQPNDRQIIYWMTKACFDFLPGDHYCAFSFILCCCCWWRWFSKVIFYHPNNLFCSVRV